MAHHPSPAESAAELETTLAAAPRQLVRLDEVTSGTPMDPEGWCARETIGHLIDSACNNHRRFIVAQAPGVERFDPYVTDAWVDLQQHRERSWLALVELWLAYNRHLAHVMRHTSVDAGQISAMAPDGSHRVTIANLMADYVTHLRHHLGQIRAFVDASAPRWPVGLPVHAATAHVPESMTLHGRRVDLEPVDPDRHVAHLFSGSASPEGDALWTYLPYGPFADVDAMRAWLRPLAHSIDPLFFAVVERASGRAIGMCSLMRIVPDMGTIELGHIWYVPGAQGTGVNADVASTLLHACFEQWGYRRAEWKCDSLNARSRAAALGLGFTFEGIFRQHMVCKGRNRDTAWFSLLDVDWPAARAALEARLS